MTWAVVRVRLAVSHLPRARGPGCGCGCGGDPVVEVAVSLLPPVVVVVMMMMMSPGEDSG